MLALPEIECKSQEPEIVNSRPSSINLHEKLMHASNESLPLINCSPHTPKQSGEQFSRRKKRGWWDTTPDKVREMNRITGLLHSQDLYKSRTNSNTSHDSTAKQPQPVLVPSGNAKENEKLPTIEPKILRTAAKIDVELKEESVISKKTDINEDPQLTKQSEIPKKSQRRVKRPPWNFEIKEQSEVSREEEALTDSSGMKWIKPTSQPEIEQSKTPESRRHSKPSTTPKLFNDIKALIDKPDNTIVSKVDVYGYLIENNMEQTAAAFLAENNISETSVAGIQLKSFVARKDFGRAIVLVQKVLNEIKEFRPEIQPNFEDLTYVLSKYLYIHLVEKQQYSSASKMLEMVIRPIIEREHQKGGARKEWFMKDFGLLQDLLSGSPSNSNCYISFNWDLELAKFWASIDFVNDGATDCPLFAYALAAYFNWTKHKSFDRMYGDSIKFSEIQSIIVQHQLNIKPVALETKPPTASKPQKNIAIEIDTPASRKNTAKSMNSERSSVTERSKATGFSIVDLPPIPKDMESSDFALAKICGPAPTTVTVLDVNYIVETDELIAITAGIDKDILIWDVRKNSLISTLHNSSFKSVSILKFHPSFPELFISCDMDFDVKLWNWRDGNMIRWWKKHHTRVIHKIGFIPGDDTCAVSCSGDQSLKIWNIHSNKKTHRGKIHANEPITSFTFSGSATDPLQQKILISLSHCIRIYKLRTATLLHTINFADLKQDKITICDLVSHPIYDNYVLISSDINLRLVDLSTEQICKTYSGRFNSTKLNISGNFSPAGTFIYANSYEVRKGSQHNVAKIKEQGIETGILLWKVNSGKLETREMSAMDSVNVEMEGISLQPTPVLASKWINIAKKVKGRIQNSKAMVTVGVDNILRLYI